MRDFMDYVSSLEQAGEKMSRESWIEWIIKEDFDLKCQDSTHELLSFSEMELILDQLEADGFMNLSVEEAEKIFSSDDAQCLILNAKFIEFLSQQGKDPYEWDYDDLGNFFREQGFATI